MVLPGRNRILFLLLMLISLSDAAIRTLKADTREVSRDTSGESLTKVSLDFLDASVELTPQKELLFESGPSEGDEVVLYQDAIRVYYLYIQASKFRKDGFSEVTTYTGAVSFDTSRDWHSISLSFQDKVATLEVDGISNRNYIQHIPKLAPKIYITRYQSLTKGAAMTFQRFTGCVDNFTLNGENLQDSDLFDGTLEGCTYPPNVVSFDTANSYLNLTLPGAPWPVILLQYDFRIFTVGVVLVAFDLDTGEKMEIVLTDANKIRISMGTEQVPFNSDEKPALTLNDGSYHNLVVVYGKQGLYVTFDGKYEMKTTTENPFASKTGANFTAVFLGNVPDSGTFNGCMRNFYLGTGEAADNWVKFSSFTNNNADFGKCPHKDWCLFDVCTNKSPCDQQDKSNYDCQCRDTGFEGLGCVTPATKEQSCEEVTFSPGETEKRVKIDPDSAGPISPFWVTCKSADGAISTEAASVSATDVSVTAYPHTASITYNRVSDTRSLKGLTGRSEECEQSISYTCKDARLLTKKNDDYPYVYWYDAGLKSHYYWGGSNDSFPYTCANGATCKCDSSLGATSTDSGLLTTKGQLPVLGIHFNEVLEEGKDKDVTYSVGPLVCKGDVFLSDSNALTFTGSNSLPLKVDQGDTPVTILMLFKTRSASAYLIRSETLRTSSGSEYFFALGLLTTRSLFVTIKSEHIDIESFPIFLLTALNRDSWHTLYFELNHKVATVQIDKESFTVWRASEFTPYSKLYPTQTLHLGGDGTGVMSLAGCIKNFRINGKAVDLFSLPNVTGVHKGCSSGCREDSCLNGGECTGYYSTYSCDCSKTAFTGYYCGKAASLEVERDFSDTYDIDLLPENTGTTIMELTLITGVKNSSLFSLRQTGQVTADVSINEKGELIGRLAAGEKVWEATLAGKVNDETPHVVKLEASGTAEAPTITLRRDNISSTGDSNIGQPFTDSGTRTLMLVIGKTDESLGINNTFEGCIYSLEAFSKKVSPVDLLTGTVTGMGKEGQCAPSLGPADAMAIQHEEERIATASMIRTNARVPPFVEVLRVRPPLEAMYNRETGKWYVPLYQPVQLTCSVSGTPTPRIIWKKDGDVVTKMSFWRIDTLTILPEKSNAGHYHCEAQNAWGISRSAGTFQLVYPASPASFTKLADETRVAVEGEQLILTCDDGPESDPKAIATWRKITNSGIETKQTIWVGGTSLDDRLHVTESGDLLFRYALPEDETSRNQTVFACLLINPVSGDWFPVRDYKLTVNPPTDVDYKERPPSIIDSVSSPVEVKEGDGVRLWCILRDYKTPAEARVTWHFAGATEAIANDMSARGEWLHLRNVSQAEAGLYTCKVNNSEKNVTVNVQSRPMWESHPDKVTVYNDETVVISCKLKGDNFAVQWFSNLQPLTANDRYVFSDNNTMLTLSNVSKENDIQTLSCEATQEGMTLRAEGFLNVVERVVVSSTPGSATLQEDDTSVLVITCEAMADPVLNLTFTWTKDDEPWCDIKPEKNNLKQIVNVSKDKKSSRLKIDGSKLSEDDLEVFKGRYTCTVDDGIGSATANTYVHIAESEGLSTGAIVGIVLGSILGVVIIAGIIAYFVYHRNTSSNSYGMTVGAYKNPAYSS